MEVVVVVVVVCARPGQQISVTILRLLDQSESVCNPCAILGRRRRPRPQMSQNNQDPCVKKDGLVSVANERGSRVCSKQKGRNKRPTRKKRLGEERAEARDLPLVGRQQH